MIYTFKIKRNVFMYNHLLTVSYGQESYEALVESLPTEKETMAIWLDDFGFNEENINAVKTEMIRWFSAQNINCVFNDGKADKF